MYASFQLGKKDTLSLPPKPELDSLIIRLMQSEAPDLRGKLTHAATAQANAEPQAEVPLLPPPVLRALVTLSCKVHVFS